jgi:acyl carrier protein
MSEARVVVMKVLYEYVGDDANLHEDLTLNLDSLDIAQVKVEIEDELKIEIPDDAVFKSANDLIEYIERGEFLDVVKNTE